jgi:hypothetical protein
LGLVVKETNPLPQIIITRDSSQFFKTMDDDLLFAISSLSPKTSSLPIIEDNLSQILLGPPSWFLFLKQNFKQFQLLLQGILYVLDSSKSTQKGLRVCLGLLFIFCEQPQILSHVITELAKVVRGVMRVLGEGERGSGKDEILRKFNVENDGELASQVLKCLCSSENTSASLVRVECFQYLKPTLVRYIEQCFENKSTLQPQRILALNLIEQLSFANKDNSHVFAEELGPVLLKLIQQRENFEIRDISIRALINIANDYPQTSGLLISMNILHYVMDGLIVVFPIGSTELNLQEARDFDTILSSLTLLANLVEFPESNGSVEFGKQLAWLRTLCGIYSASLPLRTRQALENGNSLSTIEFSWTPEELIISSHACLVIGCLVRDSKDTSDQILNLISGGTIRGFSPCVQVLQGFLDFQLQAGVLTPECEATVSKVAKYFSQANHRSMLPPPTMMGKEMKKKKRKEG